MYICHHTTNIALGIWATIGLIFFLTGCNIFFYTFLIFKKVAVIYRINLTQLRAFNISMAECPFTDRRIKRKPIYSSAGCIHQHSGRAIYHITSCDLLVTHHAAWPEIDRHLSETKYGRLRELGIGYYAAHESLDLAREFGTADALARAVRVAVQDAFAPDGETEGIGVHGPTIGSLPEFVSRVGTHLGSEPRRWKNNDSFGHVGLVPGWGGLTTWMARALELGCDTFLTGETNMFGILFAREVGLNLVIAGHYATETPGVMALSARLARDLKVEVTFIPEDVVEESG